MASPFYLRNIIKNKSAEIIVFEMFHETGMYVVTPCGPEMIISEIASIEKGEDFKKEVIRLNERPQLSISNIASGAHYLVKVKYRENPTPQMIFSIAEEVAVLWPTTYLCLVTPIGFFFDSCADILERGGDIALIDAGLISSEIQDKYLKVANDTIKQKGGE